MFHVKREFESDDFPLQKEIRGILVSETKIFREEIPKCRCPFYLIRDKLYIMDYNMSLVEENFFITMELRENLMVDEKLKFEIIEWISFLNNKIFIPCNFYLEGTFLIYVNDINHIMKIDVNDDQSVEIKNYSC